MFTKLISNKRNRLIGLSAVAAIFAIVFAVALFGSRSAETTVMKYMNASLKPDARAIFKLIPDAITDEVLEYYDFDRDEWHDAIDEFNKVLEKSLDGVRDRLEDGWTISYEVTDEDDVIGADLRDIKRDYKSYVEVTAAKDMTVELTISNGVNEWTSSADIPVIRVGRTWYIDALNMGNVFRTVRIR